METQFWISIALLKTVQNLVGRYNGYFVTNPIYLSNTALVTVSFDNMRNANMFNTCTRIIEQKYFL